MRLSRLLPSILLAALLATPVWAREPAPVIEAATEPGARASVVKQLEERLARLERLIKNQALVDMEQRLDNLQAENQRLTGQVEELNYQFEQLKKRQRELYLDVDRRLAALETKARPGVTGQQTISSAQAPATAALPSSAPVAPRVASPAAAAASDVAIAAGVSLAPSAGPATATPAAVDPAEERADYERAFNLLKEGRYDLAIAAFKAFVQKYPHGRYSDNAQYWLGEANYVQRNFKAALAEFQKVVNDYPDSPKRPDALLKLGYTYLELGDKDKARLALNSILLNYPGSTAARLAQERLKEIN